MAFGAVAVEAHGPVEDMPVPSMVTGLMANALGWDRIETERLQRLQDRLVLAVRRDREGERILDFQTAELAHDDRGWTTSGTPEGRAGGAGTYLGKHIRRRWFDADSAVTVALRLDPATEAPTLAEVAAAIDRPARPLFLGRKPCLPASRLVLGFAEAESCYAALAQAPLAEHSEAEPRGFWPREEGPVTDARRHLYGRRVWRSGVHGGEEVWQEGRAPLPPVAGT